MDAAAADGRGPEPRVADAEPASPCIQICRLDEQQYCVGCRRSMDEIAGWARMSRREKWQVLARIAERRV